MSVKGSILFTGYKAGAGAGGYRYGKADGSIVRHRCAFSGGKALEFCTLSKDFASLKTVVLKLVDEEKFDFRAIVVDDVKGVVYT